MKNILMFVNPHSRQGAQFGEEIKAWLREQGFNVLNDSFDAKKEKISDVILKHQAQRPIVLVGGGDGSVNEALPALIQSKLPLLLIPLGTANNLARTLEVPTDYKKALALLSEGEVKKVDVGVANKIPFVNVVGLGLSTQVNRVTRSEFKKWFGVFAFIFTALKVALRMTPFRVHITHNGKVHRAYTWQVTICNGRNYGNGLVIHEEASLNDELLHGLSTEVRKWWHAFFLIPALISGHFRKEQDVTTLKAPTMKLETRHKMHVDIDGDIKTKTPLEIGVLKEALHVYVPSKVKAEADPA